MSAQFGVMSDAPAPVGAEPRLTSLSRGGGCGCKIAPGVLAELLKGSPSTRRYADLMVGTDTSDDAAVYRLNEELAVVATTDFFMPIVDDPFDFGKLHRHNIVALLPEIDAERAVFRHRNMYSI